MDAIAHPQPKPLSALAWIAVWGPGLLVMLADTDAGNVVTAAQAGAQWGYRLLPLLLLLIPMLYMVQELTVRLGVDTGRGYGELIRERFGVGWAWLSAAGLAAAVIGSLVTEFTGVAGIGELYGLSRERHLAARGRGACSRSSPPAPIGASSGRAIFVGLFELAFFVVAWAAHPSLADDGEGRGRSAAGRPRIPVSGGGDHRRGVQSLDDLLPAIRDRRQEASARRPDAGALGYGFGAALTQCLTGAVLVAAAATLGHGRRLAGLSAASARSATR